MASKFKSWIEKFNHVDSDNHVSCRDCGLILDKRYAFSVRDMVGDRNPAAYYCKDHAKKYDSIGFDNTPHLFVGYIPCDENGLIDKDGPYYDKLTKYLESKGLKVIGGGE